jgi:hypothetical protein
MGSRKPKTGDNVQEISGVDVDAARFNLAVGEKKVFTIAAAKQLPSGVEWVIAFQISKEDVDLDTCVVKGFRPAKGMQVEVLRTPAGSLVCRAV